MQFTRWLTAFALTAGAASALPPDLSLRAPFSVPDAQAAIGRERGSVVSIRPSRPAYRDDSRRLQAPLSPGLSIPFGMLGGLAGGFLGSMLFRGNSAGAVAPGYGFGGSGYGGPGLLDLLFLGGIAYLIIRALRRRREQAFHPGEDPRDEAVSTRGPFGIVGSDWQSRGELIPREALERFKAERTADFFALQTAWSSGTLAGVGDRMTNELRDTLSRDLMDLQFDNLVNRLESLVIRDSEVVSQWSEGGQDYATVRFQGTMIDYVVNRTTGRVVEGSRDRPIEFDEDWTFVRDSRAQSPWILAAIERNRLSLSGDGFDEYGRRPA